MKFYQVGSSLDQHYTGTLTTARELAKQLIDGGNWRIEINEYYIDGRMTQELALALLNGLAWADDIRPVETWVRDKTRRSGMRRER